MIKLKTIVYSSTVNAPNYNQFHNITLAFKYQIVAALT